MLCIHGRKLGKVSLLYACLVFTSCISADKDKEITSQSAASNKPVGLKEQQAASEEAEKKSNQVQVTIFDETPLSVEETEGCRNGYFKWLDWKPLDKDKELTLNNQKQFIIGGNKVAVRWSGDPLKGKLNRIPGRMFEEDLALLGYSYPYQGLIFFGEGLKLKSSLEIDFGEQGMDHSYVMALGQLFRYTDYALTELLITAPGINFKEDADLVQSAAAYQSRDFDAPLNIQFRGESMRIFQDGPTGSNSEFLFLRLKKGKKLRHLKIEVKSERWPEAHPDQVEIGFAKLFCGERPCEKASQVIFYDPGIEVASHQLFSKDPLLVLEDLSPQANTQYTSIGPGGRLELKLNGVSINRENHDLTVHLRKGKCINRNDIQIAIRESAKAPWLLIDRFRMQCDRIAIDLYEHSLAREIQLRNIASPDSKRVIDVEAVTCQN